MHARQPASDSSPPSPAWRDAVRLAAQGRAREALKRAVQANRAVRDPALDVLIARLRLEAFGEGALEPGAESWPPLLPDPFPGVRGLPEIAACGLNAKIMAGAILHHGALLVRGLVQARRATALADGVDRAIAEFGAWMRDPRQPATPWFTPATLPEDCAISGMRAWTLETCAVWAADSPCMLFELTELLEGTGLIAMVTGYLQERPALSVGKTALRRVPATLQHTGWHQDGAFLGPQVRSVNLWLALSPCGRDAPGIDLVPKRIPCIVESGTHGALFPWTVGPAKVDEAAGEVAVVSPEFAAGDALLFDHMLLHRTGLPAGRTRDRRAIEAWMFAPSRYPMGQVPLVL